MYQSASRQFHSDPESPSTKHFSSLLTSSAISKAFNQTHQPLMLAQGIAKASSSFGRLRQRLWDVHVKLRTKVNVFKAAVLTILFSGCETWTTYRRPVKILKYFQQRCFRSICGTKWQDRVSNRKVLHRCGTSSDESHIIKAQLRWAGHLAKMENHNIPKALPFGQLEKGKRLVGRPRLRYKDTLKYNLKDYGIYPGACEVTVQELTRWHAVYGES